MYKFIPTIIFFLLCFFDTLKAQDIRKADSLLAIYHDELAADTLKIKVLGKLYNTYLYNDTEKAKSYLTIARDLSEKIDYQKGIADSELRRGALFELAGQLDSAQLYYQDAQEKYRQLNDRKGIEASTYNLGAIAYYQGDFQKAIDLFKGNIKRLQAERGKVIDMASSYNMLSRVYQEMGYFRIALENSLRALKIYESHNDELRKADALNSLASIEDELGHAQQSITYNLQAGEIYKKHHDDIYYAYALQDIGATYLGLKDYANALHYLRQSLTLSQRVESNILEAAVSTNLGIIYREQGSFEEAKKYAEAGLAIYEEMGEPRQVAKVLHVLGETYLRFHQSRKALPILNRAIALSDSIQSNVALQKAYSIRSEIFEELGRFDRSLEDYKKYHSLSDTILNETKSRQIEELRVIHDLEQKEKEITLLARTAELEQVKKTRLWISLLAVLGLGSLLFWIQWHRRKKEKELEVEKRKVALLENQRLNMELGLKKQELTSKTLQLCRKNEFLQSLEKEVKDFKSIVEGPDKHRLEKLRRKISRDRNADSDWEDFLRSFETVHPDFNRLLLQKYPDLAPNEIRLACLMRMNLESKDIANLLNITPDGVKKARYRIRKKMKKDSSVNLTEYFMNFGNTASKAAV